MERIKLDDELNPELIKYLEDEILQLCHSKDYIQNIKNLCSTISDNLSVADLPNDIFYSKSSYEGALLSCLAVLRGLQDILEPFKVSQNNLNKNLKRGYCIVRPPGHHSMCANSAGFCIFNNVAIAA